jgi:uncharacterized protein (DUF427 family)
VNIDRVKPKPGQESVWDYPRPPVVQPTGRHIELICGDRLIADTQRALRMLETSHPPVYYIPPEDVERDLLQRCGHASYCEYKGEATYFQITCGNSVIDDVAWSYEHPAAGYEPIAGYVAFHPAKVDECRVDGEVARPQPGGYYGGWITSDVVGPFKGEPGTNGW